VNQNESAVLTCPSGQTISSIGFASYGTPTGSCGSFAASSCNEPSSKSKVEAECLGKSTCTINANDGYFGDPCWGVSKALKIQATCSGSTSGGRYMHETNLPNNPAGWMADHYGAANYIAAFRRVHDMLNAGAGSNTKIIHVWAPNVFWGAADASNSIWFKPYYPGDAYADWVGLDGYPMSPTDSFDAQFGPSLALLESMTSHPIMIAEYGVVEMNPVGTWKANWFTDLFGAQVGKHPQLRALFYQDGTDGGTDHRIDTSAQAVAAFKAAIAPAKFASSYP
jgi:hypothetical protein